MSSEPTGDDVAYSHLLSRSRRRLLEMEAEEADETAEVEAADGPSMARECVRCGFGRVTYVAMQMRSADEGQTVIYTCLSCGEREIENS